MNSIWFILNIITIIAVIYGVFILMCRLLMKKYQCTKEEAITEIFCLISSRKYYPSNDCDLIYEIHNIMQIVLGETRYKKWLNIGATYPVIEFSSNGLSCINVVTPYDIEKEKEQLEAMLVEMFKRHLRCYGVFHTVLVDWKIHPTLLIPYIQLRYASDLYENQAIKKLIKEEVSKAVNELSSKPPVDDEEDDIL